MNEKSENKFLKSPSGRGVGVGNKQYHLFSDFYCGYFQDELNKMSINSKKMNLLMKLTHP